MRWWGRENFGGALSCKDKAGDRSEPEGEGESIRREKATAIGEEKE